jgi:hypothetical protein
MTVTLLSHLMMFFFIHSLHICCRRSCIFLLYDFIAFRLVSYHIDDEVAQKET